MDDWIPVEQLQQSVPQQTGGADDWIPAQQGRGVLDQLFGLSGPRYQLWPERAARGIYAVGPGYLQDATTPKTSVSDSDPEFLGFGAGNALSAAGLANPLPPGAMGGVVPPVRMVSPTEDQLQAAVTAGYNSPAVTSLRLNPNVGTRLTNDVQSSLLQNKLDAQNAPDVLKAVSGLQNGGRFEPPTQVSQTELAGPGFHIANDTTVPAPLQISDLDLARRSLSTVPVEQTRAASIARDVIDNYLNGNIPTSDVMGGDLNAANTALVNARANAAALKRSQDITQALTRADNQAGTTYSGQNLDNATRQQLRPILNEKMGASLKKQVFQDYNPQEIAAIKSAANGTTFRNSVRSVGKALGAGHGIGGGMIALEAARSAHDYGLDPVSAGAVGLATGAAGWGLNRLGNALTRGEAENVGNVLRARSPLADQLQNPVYGARPAIAQAMPNTMLSVGRTVPNSQLAAALAQWMQQKGILPANSGDGGNQQGYSQ